MVVFTVALLMSWNCFTRMPVKKLGMEEGKESCGGRASSRQRGLRAGRLGLEY